MIKPKECPYCKQRASDYEWMFKEQQNIANGYKKIIEEMKKELAEVKQENVILGYGQNRGRW